MQNAPREHSAILSTFIKVPFVFKIFVLSIFECCLIQVILYNKDSLLYCLHLLLHDSVVHITVIAINYAGIRTVSYSDPILVDLTGPLISNIIDGEKGEIYSTTIACITMQRFSKTCLK